eukprot:tig00021072_g17989.t1
MGYKTPGETYAALEKAGARKVLDLPWTKTFTQGFLAGLVRPAPRPPARRGQPRLTARLRPRHLGRDPQYVGFGAMASIAVAGGLSCEDGHPNHNDEYDNPGLQKLLYGSIFPVGLLMVLFTGAELITSNIMVDGLELIHRFSWLTFRGVCKNAIISWVGNFAGALFAAYFLAWHTELFAKDPWHIFVMKIAIKKYGLKPYQVFLRGIGCNTLVCMAVYLSYSADDVIGKFVNMWFPIMAFAAIGFEHCVANMFLLPLALLYGANDIEPRIGWTFIFENILMSTMGNLVGAIVMTDLFFWYGFGRGHLRANPLLWKHPAFNKAPKPLGQPREGDKEIKRPTFAEMVAKGHVAPGLASHTRSMADVDGAAGLLGLRLAEAGAGSGNCIVLLDNDLDVVGGSDLASGSGVGPRRRTCRYTKRYVRKDGRIVRVTVNAAVDHDEEGHPYELHASVVDADNPTQTGNITVDVDAQGHANVIRTADSAFCALLGYSPEELQNRPLVAVTHPDDFAVSDDAIHQVENASESTGLLAQERQRAGSTEMHDIRV